MLGDAQAKERLKQQVLQELDVIAQLRESKASTDTRAYLHVAMYIATREPKYREQARAYIHEHDPASPYLHKLVSTCTKREALKFMGDKGQQNEINSWLISLRSTTAKAISEPASLSCLSLICLNLRHPLRYSRITSARVYIGSIHF